MRVLFIGGTGVISSACSRLAIEHSMELFLFNRGQSERPVPPGAHVLHGDIRNAGSARAALSNLDFDAVVDWVAFTPEHVEADLALFPAAPGNTSSSAQRRRIRSHSWACQSPNQRPCTTLSGSMRVTRSPAKTG